MATKETEIVNSETGSKTVETWDSESVTLKKDSKGNYNWDIKCYGKDFKEILKRIEEADKILKDKYGGGN